MNRASTMSVAPEPKGAEVCHRAGKLILAKQAAKRLAKQIERRDRHGGHIEAYECRWCPGWHVGNRKPRVR